ncbi:hypothetical protein ACN27E_21130 [Mycobacterium sp. WMMD1722]|uniref:hypothetical protein n=1 Tax=Mycobacterium sp. WMMD1722 TaxID=3404117 RepID=UPI003BF51BFE
MNRLAAAGAAALGAALLTPPGTATAAANSAVSSIPANPTTLIEMHVTADCVGTVCTFNTAANLAAPGGPPLGFPGEAWSRQTITLRSNDRDVWQEADYSAPTGTPRAGKGANHDNVLSKEYKSLRDVEISVTTFGGGPVERYRVDGTSAPTKWTTGEPALDATFIVCSHIQVVYNGVNLTTPDACAQTTFG